MYFVSFTKWTNCQNGKNVEPNRHLCTCLSVFLADDKMAKILLNVHASIAQNLPKYHFQCSLDYTFLSLSVSSSIIKENLWCLYHILTEKWRLYSTDSFCQNDYFLSLKTYNKPFVTVCKINLAIIWPWLSQRPQGPRPLLPWSWPWYKYNPQPLCVGICNKYFAVPLRGIIFSKKSEKISSH